MRPIKRIDYEKELKEWKEKTKELQNEIESFRIKEMELCRHLFKKCKQEGMYVDVYDEEQNVLGYSEPIFIVKDDYSIVAECEKIIVRSCVVNSGWLGDGYMFLENQIIKDTPTDRKFSSLEKAQDFVKKCYENLKKSENFKNLQSEGDE